MKQRSDGVAKPAGVGGVLVGTALVLFLVGCQLPASTRAEIQKGTPETPSSAAAVVGTYICHDGMAYRVVLTLNTDGTYWAKGSSCLKNKGDASGSGTWKLAERRIVLAPSKEDGWMKREPRAFDVFMFKGDWIFVRADWPDYYKEHGVTDVSCFQRQVPEESYTPIADAELPLLRPFKATVEQMQPCAAYLKTTDGRRIRIGSPGATPEVAGFVAGLQEGRTYNLPEAFLKYRKGQAAEP
jgi:hypothetical protein